MEYLPIGILLILSLGLGSVIIFVSHLLGVKKWHPRKDQPFECGVPPQDGFNHRRFSVRFYLVAILFLLFDVEVIFFFPWAVIFRQFLQWNDFIIYEMGFFILILFVGYFYVLKRGALEWE